MVFFPDHHPGQTRTGSPEVEGAQEQEEETGQAGGHLEPGGQLPRGGELLLLEGIDQAGQELHRTWPGRRTGRHLLEEQFEVPESPKEGERANDLPHGELGGPA